METAMTSTVTASTTSTPTAVSTSAPIVVEGTETGPATDGGGAGEDKKRGVVIYKLGEEIYCPGDWEGLKLFSFLIKNRKGRRSL